jgi:hypothetical protein
VQGNDAGAYSVAIDNECGAVTSADAMLTLAPEPVRIRIVRGSGPEIAIEVSGPAGCPYVLEISDDAQEWTAVQTNWLVMSGTPLFYDRVDRVARFYRVRPVEVMP